MGRNWSVDIAAVAIDVLIFWMLTTVHEFAHAWTATRLGDKTPNGEGRLTLNPLAHVDWIGTVILPAMTSLFGGLFMGWGKPVNCDTSQLKGHYRGLMLVGLAGPASNFVVAGLLAGFSALVPQYTEILFRAAYLSVFLGLFNLIPVPPLDGSKVLLAMKIPTGAYLELSRFGFLLILVLMLSTGLGRWMSQASYMGTLDLFRMARGGAVAQRADKLDGYAVSPLLAFAGGAGTGRAAASSE